MNIPHWNFNFQLYNKPLHLLLYHYFTCLTIYSIKSVEVINMSTNSWLSQCDCNGIHGCWQKERWPVVSHTTLSLPDNYKFGSVHLVKVNISQRVNNHRLFPTSHPGCNGNITSPVLFTCSYWYECFVLHYYYSLNDVKEMVGKTE